MKHKKIEFTDASVGAATIFAMLDVLRELVKAKDKKGIHSILQMLSKATAGMTQLMGKRRAELSLGSFTGQFPPDHWKDMGPSQILHELSEYVSVDKAMIELKGMKIPGATTSDQKRLSAEVAKMRRKLKNVVKAAKLWISKHWPNSWTEKEESDYGNYL